LHPRNRLRDPGRPVPSREQQWSWCSGKEPSNAFNHENAQCPAKCAPQA
jgi:hypothetical protein